MRRLLALMIMMVSLLTVARAAELPQVAFYNCRRCARPPVLDGKLNDACWQNLPVMAGFYKYWTPTVEAPLLKTAARLCYDNHGLYLGITMYDQRMDKIRAAITGRDNPNTWKDDCVEVMIDPRSSGTGYMKFATNFNAARYDEKAVNMVVNAGWNQEDWRVKTSRDAGAWYIELYLPWKDLGARPHNGDIWAFDLVRYGYSSGSFRGVSWSAGGSYAAPQNFGYLGFGDFTPLTQSRLDRLAQVVSHNRGDSFRLISSGEVYTCTSGHWQHVPLSQWLRGGFVKAQQALGEARGAVSKVASGTDRDRLQRETDKAAAHLQQLRQRVAEASNLTPSGAVLLRQETRNLGSELSDLKWESLLWGLIAAQ